jgi:hypothetical protein
MSTPTITTVRIEDLFLDEDIQPRRRLDQGKVAEYADLYKAGVNLPSIAVFQDEDVLYVSDGFHRTHAAFNAGREEISAEVHQGTRRDAILYGIVANSTHPLALTTEDKRHVVTRMLQDDEWGQWSDNAIAKHCGVTQPFVSKLRRSLKTVISETQPRTYTTRHDTTATMDTSKIGGRSKSPAPVATPGVDAPEAPANGQAALPEVLVDGSSLLVYAPTPLSNGSAPPEDPHRPYGGFAALVQESIQVLAETSTQLTTVADEFVDQTTAIEGTPFPSALNWITAPTPEGRGCDLSALLDSATSLVTLLETLKAQAETSTTETTAGQVTNRQRALDVLPTLKRPYTAPKVAAATGMSTTEARRALEGLVKVKVLIKVPRKPGQYLPAKKR